MWLVVKFVDEQTVREVPSKWVDVDGLTCMWPSKRISEDRLKSYIKEEKEPHSKWRELKIKLCCQGKEFEVFEEALEAAATALNETTILEDDNESETDMGSFQNDVSSLHNDKQTTNNTTNNSDEKSTQNRRRLENPTLKDTYDLTYETFKLLCKMNKPGTVVLGCKPSTESLYTLKKLETRTDINDMEKRLSDPKEKQKVKTALQLVGGGGQNARDLCLRCFEKLFAQSACNEMTMQGSNRKGVKKFKFMNSNIQILLWECVKEVFPETDKALEELCDTQLRNHGARWRAKHSTGTPESQKEADKETPENTNEKTPDNTNEKTPENTNKKTPENTKEETPENTNEKTPENTDQT